MLRTIYCLSMKKKLGKKESVSKKGRKNAKPRPTLDDSAFDDLDVDLAHGMDYMETTETVNEGRTSSKTEELNVLNLQKHKDAQAVEILKLKTRIKKLEKR
nr:hypothetical protein [Tanacetum cinerariifolium]